jgi:tetratricopeptide (TPR) repeat protein
MIVPLVVLMTLTCATAARGEERFIDFIGGLRERQFFDTAIEYIDSISQRSDLPAEVREILDLERGITLQQKGAASRIPEDREQALTEAETSLRKFIGEHAQHAQAALANSMLGELLFERARSLMWKAAETEDAPKKLELQQSARTLVDQAKVIYQTAQDQYKAIYDAFPKFIDEQKDEEEFQRRLEAEAKYLRSWFNLVRCTYERGQTFEKGSEERKQTLIQAAELFEKIHTSRRTNQIGLHARLMMGKCFQEQDDIGRALGIYNEMLGHPSENSSVLVLKGIAQHYRLICLNDPQKNDHALVIQEATVWLQGNKQLATTQSGLGILWERAIAAEKLGGTRELPEKEKEAILRSAMDDAIQVGKYPGPYKETAAAMGRRLKLVLGEKDREPRDFATAFERARGMIAQIQQLSDDAAKAADATEKATKTAALESHLKEVGRLLQLALDLREDDSDPKAVAQSRYLLSFVKLRLGRPLDAIILAQYCFEHDIKADPDTALNATEIAMAAAVAAWNAGPPKDRDFETRTLRDVCERILTLYPQSAKGGEARMRLGSVYRTLNQPLEGAKWYLQVPEADPQYISARINAGQSYWTAWTQKAAMAAADPQGEQPDVQAMLQWKTEAKTLLTNGIQLTRQKLGDMAKPTEELAAAEVSLASILNLDGEFPATIDRLTKGAENSVVTAIEVPEGTQRPEDGIQSQSFAGLTYRLLLRAYIGTQQIDQALQTMTKLEKVGGQDILAAYTQLGMELQEELRRLKLSGENERLAAVRDSFEKFLQKVYESRNKSDYNSLLWIGETYYGLGQGVSGDAASAAAYYSKAGDAYSEIISGGLVNADNKNAVKLRLARCRRQQKQFEEALKNIEEILTENPMTLDAQFEAALILTDWGADTDPKKFTEALQGRKDATGKATAVWGWSQLARRLQQITAKDPSPELKGRFVEARYEMANCRRRFGNASDADADKLRKSAMAEITSFVQVYRDLDDVSFARFDRLYQDIQADLGQAPTPLDRNAVASAPEEEPAELAQNATGNPAAAATGAEPAATEESGSSTLLIVVGVGVCLAIAGGLFYFMRKPKERVRVPGPTAAPKFSGLNVAVETEPAIPQGMSFEAPSEPDFSGFAGIGGGKKAAPAARSAVAKPGSTAAKPTAPVAKAAPSATAATSPAPSATASPASPAPDAKPAAKPAPKPVSADGSPRPAAPTTGEVRPKPAAPSAATGEAPVRKPAAPSATSSTAGAVSSTDPAAPKPVPRPRPPAPEGSAPAKPAAPRPAASKPASADGTAPEAKPAAPRPPAAKPAVPKPASTDGAIAEPKPVAPRPAAPKPAAPRPEGTADKPVGERPAVPRPAAPKPAADPAAGERPAPRPPSEAPPVKRPKPPEAEE